MIVVVIVVVVILTTRSAAENNSTKMEQPNVNNSILPTQYQQHYFNNQRWNDLPKDKEPRRKRSLPKV